MSQGNDHAADPWNAWRADCQTIGVNIAEERQADFERLYALLCEANRTVNLTRITALEDFLYRHLLDSLAVAPLIPPESNVADVGSGAGFPALPLALARPDIRMTAVESTGKKCRFIREAAESLGLENVAIVPERAETLGRSPAGREKYDIVIARAVSSLPILLELCLPLLKPRGRFLAMKGVSFEPELTASTRALKTLGGKLEEIQTFPHPRLEGSRLLIFEKVGRTPAQYPRQAGLPAKNPL